LFYDRRPNGEIDKLDHPEVLSSTTMKTNIEKAMTALSKAGITDPTSKHYFVNIGGTQMNMKENLIPTVTATRGGSRAYWSTFLNRRLSATELCRFQGGSPAVMPELFNSLLFFIEIIATASGGWD